MPSGIIVLFHSVRCFSLLSRGNMYSCRACRHEAFFGRRRLFDVGTESAHNVCTFEEGDINVHTICVHIRGGGYECAHNFESVEMPLASVKEIWCLVFVRYEGAAELHVVGRFC